MAAIVLFATALAPLGAACAHALKTIYSFCAKAHCADGTTPVSAPIMDQQGNLYGTTPSGGAFGYGTVYEMIRGPRYRHKILYSFCHDTGCPDGATPYASLVRDGAGNLYGLASGGGATNNGAAFELMPSVNGGRWTFKVVYNFCSRANCADGRVPTRTFSYPGQAAGLAYDGTSALFTVTGTGGAGGLGAALTLTPGNPSWTETVIHDFCPNGFQNCVDVTDPNSSLRFDASGNAYGTAFSQSGAIYELSPGSGALGWTEKVLHEFDGANPGQGVDPNDLSVDGSGALLGVTTAGGTQSEGITFKLAPDGADWTETVLYSFCTPGIPNCTDGKNPNRAPVRDPSGVLYGTTAGGGSNGGLGGGLIYRLARRFHVVYTFCIRHETCDDGSTPNGITFDANGDIFGTTEGGGAHSSGTVFELTK